MRHLIKWLAKLVNSPWVIGESTSPVTIRMPKPLGACDKPRLSPGDEAVIKCCSCRHGLNYFHRGR